MTDRRQTKSAYFQPVNLVATAEEMIRNGGNCSAALRLLFPDHGLTNPAINTLAQRVRRSPIVRKVLEEARVSGERALSQAVKRFEASQDRTADELARLAFSQLRDVVSVETVTDRKTKERRQVMRVKDFSLISDDAHRAIAKVSQRADGTLTVEMHDKLTALRDLARLKGWIADKPADNTAAVSLIIQR